MSGFARAYCVLALLGFQDLIADKCLLVLDRLQVSTGTRPLLSWIYEQRPSSLLHFFNLLLPRRSSLPFRRCTIFPIIFSKLLFQPLYLTLQRCIYALDSLNLSILALVLDTHFFNLRLKPLNLNFLQRFVLQYFFDTFLTCKLIRLIHNFLNFI